MFLLTGSIALITAATAQEAPAPPNPSVPQTAPQRQAPPGAPSGSPGGRRGGFGVQPLAEMGFQPIFDGKSLAGWDCDPDYWRVENGEIVGETRIDHQPPQNIFCIWKGGQPSDFDLKMQYKLTGVNGGNSGIQYRSIELPNVAKWVMKGYQADIDLEQTFTDRSMRSAGAASLQHAA